MEATGNAMVASLRPPVLDTTVVIAHLRGFEWARRLLEWAGRTGRPVVSTVTHVEVYQGMREEETEDTKALLDTLESRPLDREVAWKAGEILRSLRATGMEIYLADGVIAATALLEGRPVLTLNVKHFRRVPGLEVLDGLELRQRLTGA